MVGTQHEEHASLPYGHEKYTSLKVTVNLDHILYERR